MAGPLVLSEDEALEIIALLVTAARTQLDESAEYAPLRMLAAVGRLAGFIAERATPETRDSGAPCSLPDAFRTADQRARRRSTSCAARSSTTWCHFGLESDATWQPSRRDRSRRVAATDGPTVECAIGSARRAAETKPSSAALRGDQAAPPAPAHSLARHIPATGGGAICIVRARRCRHGAISRVVRRRGHPRRRPSVAAVAGTRSASSLRTARRVRAS
jgi:hypothetical protein